MRRNLGILTFCGLAIVAGSVTPSQAATLTIYNDEATFLAGVGGPVATQDFEGYVAGTNLSGVEFLPGVSVTTNMAVLQAFGADPDRRLFGSGAGRQSGNAHYDVALSLPYRALAFDIKAFEADPDNSSTGQGPGVVTVSFADATSRAFDVLGNFAGDPIFIGLISDTAITGVRWAEALEGSGGNEETALDNFRVGLPVPEPTTLLLVGAGLLGLAARRRS